jgi:hypothetical protein
MLRTLYAYIYVLSAQRTAVRMTLANDQYSAIYIMG